MNNAFDAIALHMMMRNICDLFHVQTRTFDTIDKNSDYTEGERCDKRLCKRHKQNRHHLRKSKFIHKASWDSLKCLGQVKCEKTSESSESRNINVKWIFHCLAKQMRNDDAKDKLRYVKFKYDWVCGGVLAHIVCHTSRESWKILGIPFRIQNETIISGSTLSTTLSFCMQRFSSLSSTTHKNVVELRASRCFALL